MYHEGQLTGLTQKKVKVEKSEELFVLTYLIMQLIQGISH